MGSGSMGGVDKASILVVDDDLIVTDMIVSAIEDRYHVEVANSGLEATRRVNEQAPDLILLDVSLGDARGYDICRQFKSNPKTQRIPIIFISSYSGAVDKVEGFNSGGVDYVTKPIEMEELKMRISTHITLSRLQHDLEQAVSERTLDLEKSNEALRASLEHRETEIHAIEESILNRINKYIHPYLNKLEKLKLGEQGGVYFDIVRSNLNELIPSTAKSLSACYLKLTPAEIKVADLIRQGIQTKEIAGELNLSAKSVFYYRNQIRKKLGLLKTKVNLATYLDSLSRK